MTVKIQTTSSDILRNTISLSRLKKKSTQLFLFHFSITIFLNQNFEEKSKNKPINKIKGDALISFLVSFTNCLTKAN